MEWVALVSLIGMAMIAISLYLWRLEVCRIRCRIGIGSEDAAELKVGRELEIEGGRRPFRWGTRLNFIDSKGRPGTL